MSTAKPSLAKLSRPRLYSPVTRERLFNLLDRYRNHPMVWISGPPGSGKTTLVASYVESGRLRSHWYHVDVGDADPATLFHYLTEITFLTRHHKKGLLPQLPTGAPLDLRPFARRFFRILFARFPADSVIIFDNCHEAASDTFNGLLREAAEEIPEHLRIICISRRDPPEELSRMEATQRLAKIEWDALRFTADEAGAMIRTLGADESRAAMLHRRTDGWAAGIVLMLANRQDSAADVSNATLDSWQAPFDFFASEVLSQTSPAQRETLLRTALFPKMTAEMAIAVTGDPNAGTLIEDLYRQHYFIDRRGNQPSFYHFHDLFREFLLSRLAASYDASRINELRLRTAHVLKAAGDFESAATILIESGHWDDAGQLIGQMAADLFATGRWQTVLRWLSTFPTDVFERNPWLLYWMGMAQGLTGHPDRVKTLGRACDEFANHHNASGQVRALDALIIYGSDYARLREQISRLARIRTTAGAASSLDSVVATSGLLRALLLADPSNPDISSFSAELREYVLSIAVRPSDELLGAASALLFFSWLKADPQLAMELIAHVDPMAENQTIASWAHIRWVYFKSLVMLTLGEFEEALSAASAALSLSRNHGARHGQAAALTHVLGCHLARCDLGAARETMTDLEGVMYPTMLPMWFQFQMWQAVLALQEQRLDDAAAFAETALASADAAGMPYFRIHVRSICAGVWLERREFDTVERLIAEAWEVRSHAEVPVFDVPLLWVEAGLHLLRERRFHAHGLMREALTKARLTRNFGRLNWIGSTTSRLFSEALTVGIEPNLVKELIRTYRLASTSAHADNWPWPVRIRVLGDFSLELEGKPLRSTRKAQRKPLEMLRAIVALGGRNVDAVQLEELLWPDTEADSAHSNLRATLHRLRKLLGRSDALRLDEGRISLDAGVCWLDITEFESLAATAAEKRGSPTLEDLSRLNAALDLYRGHLMPQESQPWVLSARERLRARASKLCLALAETYEMRGEWPKATKVYERGIELEPASEVLYRRLMVCLRETGQAAEARDVYQRCRRVLSSTLATLPSRETVAVFQSLHAA